MQLTGHYYPLAVISYQGVFNLEGLFQLKYASWILVAAFQHYYTSYYVS